MKIERPDIAYDWRLNVGNIVSVVQPDTYCIRMVVSGLDSKGDPAQTIITLTRNELRVINEAIK